MKKITLFMALSFMLFSACQDAATETSSAVNVSPSDKEIKTDDAKAQTVAIKTAGYNIGDTATDFKLKNIDGNMVSMSDYKDAKGFILVFTCNTCPYAVRYEDRIIDLHNKYASKGYPLIAINPNDPDVKPGDSFEKMIERAESKSFEFPYVFDSKQDVFPAYGATKTPHIFILNNKLGVEYIGAIDNSPNDPSGVTERYVEDAIAALMKGEKPNPNLTKAIGCSIKVKK